MEPNTKSVQEQRADAVYKIIGAVGFLLNAFDELNRLFNFKQRIFSMGLKYAATKFRAELEKAERHFTHGEVETNEVMMQQMADSYDVVDQLLTLQLEAGRILTPEARLAMNEDLLATAQRWGVTLQPHDVYTPTASTL